VKPLPLIGSIVNVAQSVKTKVYDRWKARILHTSFEPADLPIERVDANTGFTLLSTTPIMKEAFREELEANDRSFLEDTAEELLSTGELESLWSTYSDRFDSRQQFEEGVAALRRAAADLELREELDPALFEEVGGYEKAVANIDKLHADDAAQGDLDAIVTMFEALQNADGVGTSIRQLFEDVRADLTSSEASPSPLMTPSASRTRRALRSHHFPHQSPCGVPIAPPDTCSSACSSPPCWAPGAGSGRSTR
jgi:hypothetical protein